MQRARFYRDSGWAGRFVALGSAPVPLPTRTRSRYGDVSGPPEQERPRPVRAAARLGSVRASTVARANPYAALHYVASRPRPWRQDRHALSKRSCRSSTSAGAGNQASSSRSASKRRVKSWRRVVAAKLASDDLTVTVGRRGQLPFGLGPRILLGCGSVKIVPLHVRLSSGVGSARSSRPGVEAAALGHPALRAPGRRAGARRPRCMR
jgi:hypothetical protein